MKKAIAVFLLLVFPWATTIAEAQKPITQAQAMEIAKVEFVKNGRKKEDIQTVEATPLKDGKGWHVWVATSIPGGHAFIVISPEGKVVYSDAGK